MHLPFFLLLSCGAASVPPDVVPAPAVEAPVVPVEVPVPSPTHADRVVEAAERYIGEPYAWGGRNTVAHPGIDCLGLLFLAVGEVTGTPWRKFPVDPSKMVAGGLLGTPVLGLDGVPREKLNTSLLEKADIVYLLARERVIPDAPLWTDAGQRYWPWHTALYAGNGEVLHAEPGRKVRRQALLGIWFDAVFVTRIAGMGEVAN